MKILGFIHTAYDIAIAALKRNKGRTILTILGMVIGIMAVVIVMSAGQSLKASINGQMAMFGSDAIQIEIKTPNTSHTSTENAMGQAMGIVVTTLRESDLEAVLKLPNISDGYAGVMAQAPVSYQEQMKRGMIWGVSASYPNLDKEAKLATGQWYTAEEDRSLARVVVLGGKIKENLFGAEEAVGKFIKIGKGKYKVIGVAQTRGAAFMFDMDSTIFMPLRTCQKVIMGIDHVSWVMVKMVDTSLEGETVDNINALLAERHDVTFGNPDKYDFAVMSMAQAMDIMNKVMGGVTLLLVALAAISLLVGGVGIMNIMYVSISERTYEIGLRKAVGATSRNILWQFLFETVVITFFGGIIGVVLGVAVTFLFSLVAGQLGLDLPFIISFKGIAIACLFSIGVGFVFGIYPAKKASALDPIEALRFE